MRALAFLAFIPALVDMTEKLYHRFDIDYPEGGFPPPNWLCWGTCIPMSGMAEHRFRYFQMHLPFSKIGYDFSRDKEVWCDLWLWKFAGKWSYHWIPRAEFV